MRSFFSYLAYNLEKISSKSAPACECSVDDAFVGDDHLFANIAYFGGAISFSFQPPVGKTTPSPNGAGDKLAVTASASPVEVGGGVKKVGHRTTTTLNKTSSANLEFRSCFSTPPAPPLPTPQAG